MCASGCGDSTFTLRRANGRRPDAKMAIRSATWIFGGARPMHPSRVMMNLISPLLIVSKALRQCLRLLLPVTRLRLDATCRCPYLLVFHPPMYMVRKNDSWTSHTSVNELLESRQASCVLKADIQLATIFQTSSRTLLNIAAADTTSSEKASSKDCARSHLFQPEVSVQTCSELLLGMPQRQRVLEARFIDFGKVDRPRWQIRGCRRREKWLVGARSRRM